MRLVDGIDLNQQRGVNAATPTVASDICTKGYADSGDTARMRYRGAWISAGSYEVNDVVTVNLGATTYICNTATASGGASPSGSASWTQLASVIDRSPGWTALPLNASYTNFGGAYTVARYCLMNGIVYVQGTVTKATALGASDAISGTGALPVGFRPSGNLIFSAVVSGTNNPALRLLVTPAGTISLTMTTVPTTTGLNFSLAGITFPADG